MSDLQIDPEKKDEVLEILKKLNYITVKMNEKVALFPMLENNLHNINFSKMEIQMIVDEITDLNAKIAKSTNEVEEKQLVLKETSFFKIKARRSLKEGIRLLLKNTKINQIILKNYYTKLGITEYQLKTLNNSHPHTLNPPAVIREYKKTVETLYNPTLNQLNEILGEQFPLKEPTDFTLTPFFSIDGEIIESHDFYEKRSK